MISILPRHSSRAAFTLVEVLVSTVLIVAIMVLLLGTVDQTQRLWARSRGKATQFQSARAAFEVMSRRLSQATLNTYWRANDADIAQNRSNLLFRRHSELQFLSGPMEAILRGKTPVPNLNGGTDKIAENYPSHGVFFTVPLGATEYLERTEGAQLRQFRSLDSMLTAAGYFIEFGDDPDVPIFVRELEPKLPPRYRYRLMEMTIPGEKFNIYERLKDDNRVSDPRIFDEDKNYYDGLTTSDRRLKARTAFVRPYWMLEGFRRIPVSDGSEAQQRFQYARVLSENIVALIILPKLAIKDRVRIGSNPPVADPDALELAPDYAFDSWRVITGQRENDPLLKIELDNRTRDNLLPPTVQVTMVAIDEPSAERMRLTLDEDKPKWLDGLFRSAVSEEVVLEDLAKLEKAIRDDPQYRNVNYRIFTTDVVIRGSKWSRDPNAL